MNMRERAAKAIYDKRNGAGAVPWGRREDAHKAPYLMDADAVLSALEKPTEEMLRFRIPYDTSIRWKSDAELIFTAMINAARDGACKSPLHPRSPTWSATGTRAANYSRPRQRHKPPLI